MATKYVYSFGSTLTEGRGSDRNLLGGKGANLAEMTRINLPVPPGFTISTDVCTHYYRNNSKYPDGLKRQVSGALKRVENEEQKKFGDGCNPLLVSVRSGARDSMPGMMDTILNLGLNDITTETLADKTGNPGFAWDCYRRFVQMYGDVVMGVQREQNEDHDPFEYIIDCLKEELEVEQDMNLGARGMCELVVRFKRLILERTGHEFPQDPDQQLWGAIGAVFGSWMNDRAMVYRRRYNIPAEWGTAVNIQTMVYGNMGDTSATGVAFTRDPASGERVFYGEYLINAQGEDVVAGVRTPKPIAEMTRDMPKAHRKLEKVRKTLERHFRDMQDFEFTIEDNRLYVLQTRNGKRTGVAAVRIACEMVKEKLISREDAVKRIPADSLEQFLTPIFDTTEVVRAKRGGALLATGLPAGPGAASGIAIFNADEAAEIAGKGSPVILVRVETSPEDLRGMIAAEGILTARGGVSSHAALVARQMGKVCVCGCSALQIDYAKKTLKIGGHTLCQGDYLSIDGTLGEVYAGRIRTAPSEVVQVLVDKSLKPEKSREYQNFSRLMRWTDRFRRMDVRTNADHPDQALSAIAFGAVGIGLCRTEHMFFEGDRIYSIRKMILAEHDDERKAALAELLPFQREDFMGIFRVMKGYPCNIRMLDPPLHEFLPHEPEALVETASRLNVTPAVLESRVAALHEDNPMLGHRGCRLGNIYPEITEMQVRAIFEAAVHVMKENSIKVRPEIMIPLVGFPRELELQLEVVKRVAREIQEESGRKINYMVGTMIEIPRAALVADEIAEHAEFFSFGTNDLTQTTLGMSRDDSASFLPSYQEMDIIPGDPFVTLDTKGPGRLMDWSIRSARSVRKGIKLGICGEHGGDPATVEFCHDLGLDYVSCSPFRVPVARLAAAQAALKGGLVRDATRRKSVEPKAASKKKRTGKKSRKTAMKKEKKLEGGSARKTVRKRSR